MRFVAANTEGFLHSLNFDRVSKPGARTVRFDITDGAWINTGIRQGLLDQVGLCAGIWCSQGRCPAAMVLCTTADHRMNNVPVPLRRRQRLEHYHAHTFGSDITVGLAGKGLAATIDTKHAGTTETLLQLR